MAFPLLSSRVRTCMAWGVWCVWKCDLDVSWVQTVEILRSRAKKGEKPLEVGSPRQQS